MADDNFTWVSKTDVTQFVRCPFAFSLLDAGEIAFEDTIDEIKAGLLAGGYEFEEFVESALPAVDLSFPEVLAALEPGTTLFGTPDFRNDELRIHGRPDGIVGADGALLPIEIKSHKHVQPLDELELAFYWLLLAPYRNDFDEVPEGRLVLRRDGEPVTVPVRITQDRLDRAAYLIECVRHARVYGVAPRICRCRVCSVLRRDEVLESVTRRRDPTMVYGVAGVYANLLDRFGIKSWESLVDCDTNALAAKFAAAGYPSVTSRIVERWVLHARSFQSQAPVLADTAVGIGVDDKYIALDLEYDEWVWLIGACVVVGEEREYHFLWADSPEDELTNLKRLFGLVSERAGFPVITWSGTTADIPSLRKAADRHAVYEDLKPVIAAHRDIFRWAENNLRIPVPSLGLKDVGTYFGAVRTSDIGDGLMAVSMYKKYLRTKNPELRQRLINYNRDDVDSLMTVFGELRKIEDETVLCRAVVKDDSVRGATPKPAAGTTLGERIRDELAPVPKGIARGPECIYRMHYVRYRQKSLGTKPEGLVPTQEAARGFALEQARARFPGFEPTWEIG